MTKTELYLGRTIGISGYVSDKHWIEFIDNTVSHRFPSGFSIMELTGQWKNISDEVIIREKTMMIIICHHNTIESNNHIDSIKTTYKCLFDQDSVMEISYEVNVKF